MMIGLARSAWRLARSNPALFRRRVGMLLRAPTRNAAALSTTRRRARSAAASYGRWLRCSPGRDPAPPHPVGPLLSVIMPVYDTEAAVLEEAIESVLAQTYPRWELCIADDASPAPHVRAVLERYARREGRIRVAFRGRSGHISAASNSAIALARGDFIVLLDHDDRLTPDALAAIARVAADNPAVDFIYSDEDKIGFDGRRIEPFFKPAWSPTLLTSCNYITHLAALRRTLVLEVGGLRPEMVGSQDHDLFLRVAERAWAVAHIPRVLYSWRMSATSTAAASSAKPYAVEAARRALEQTIARRGLPAAVHPAHLNGLFVLRHRVATPARVSLIVRGGTTRWRALLRPEGLVIRDAVLLRDGDTPEAGTLPGGIALAPSIADLTGDYLLWIDAGHRPTGLGAVTSLLEHLQYGHVGVAGGVTTHLDGGVLQSGIVIGEGGQPAYAYAGLPALPQHNFYLNLKDLVREVSALYVGGCAMRRATWEELGGFTPGLPPALAMVDLCLRAVGRGYSNICTPLARFDAQRPLPPLPPIAGRPWPWRGFADPFWNPNLSAPSTDGLPFRCAGDAPPRIFHLIDGRAFPAGLGRAVGSRPGQSARH